MEKCKFQVYTLNEAFSNWNDNKVQEVFTKIIALKKDGYENKYPDGVLPVDTTEFVGTHVILAKVEVDRITPIMGFRSITLDTCEKHFLTFPLLQIAKSADAKLHQEMTNKIIGECKKNNVLVHYNGGWTIHPEFRRDQDKNFELKEMMIALDFLYHDHGHHPYEVLGAGVLKYKTDLYFKKYGYDFMLDNDNNELLTIPSFYLGGEFIRFLHVKRYNELARKMGDKFKYLWDQRIELGEKLDTIDKKIAA